MAHEIGATGTVVKMGFTLGLQRRKSEVRKSGPVSVVSRRIQIATQKRGTDGMEVNSTRGVHAEEAWKAPHGQQSTGQEGKGPGASEASHAVRRSSVRIKEQ